MSATSDRSLGSPRWLACTFIAALLFERRVKPTFENSNQVCDLGQLDPESLRLIVDEGRRQAEDQVNRFRHTTDRAQILLSVSLAAMAFWVGSFALVSRTADWERVVTAALWTVGGIGLMSGLAAAAGVVVVKASFDQVDTTQMTSWKDSVLRRLAADYADAVRRGEVTVADRVTAFRQATRLVVWGALLVAMASIVAL
jgi:hypothetical protein